MIDEPLQSQKSPEKQTLTCCTLQAPRTGVQHHSSRSVLTIFAASPKISENNTLRMCLDRSDMGAYALGRTLVNPLWGKGVSETDRGFLAG
jgi:hypothetical protein